jgi:hypothetical protein
MPRGGEETSDQGFALHGVYPNDLPGRQLLCESFVSICPQFFEECFLGSALTLVLCPLDPLWRKSKPLTADSITLGQWFSESLAKLKSPLQESMTWLRLTELTYIPIHCFLRRLCIQSTELVLGEELVLVCDSAYLTVLDTLLKPTVIRTLSRDTLLVYIRIIVGNILRTNSMDHGSATKEVQLYTLQLSHARTMLAQLFRFLCSLCSINGVLALSKYVDYIDTGVSETSDYTANLAISDSLTIFREILKESHSARGLRSLALTETEWIALVIWLRWKYAG